MTASDFLLIGTVVAAVLILCAICYEAGRASR